VFGVEMEVDLVIVHELDKELIDKVKEQISDIFRRYFIEQV
jgi:hypothetical protein